MAELGRDGSHVRERQAARGYIWPPFEPGNLSSVRHGAFSERLVSERAIRIRDALLAAYPYLADEVFVEALERYTRAEARAVMLHEHVTTVSAEQGVEAVKPYLWSEATRAEANAQRFAQDCGLDPAGHARIARDLGMVASVRTQQSQRNLEALAARGRALGERLSPS